MVLLEPGVGGNLIRPLKSLSDSRPIVQGRRSGFRRMAQGVPVEFLTLDLDQQTVKDCVVFRCLQAVRDHRNQHLSLQHVFDNIRGHPEHALEPLPDSFHPLHGIGAHGAPGARQMGDGGMIIPEDVHGPEAGIGIRKYEAERLHCRRHNGTNRL